MQSPWSRRREWRAKEFFRSIPPTPTRELSLPGFFFCSDAGVE